MAVNVSGAVLASLLYDHAQSEGHQMGFLTGQIVSHMTDTISDSQINNYEMETKVFVYGSVACPRDQRFFNDRYEILPDQLNSLLPKETQNIVGWYSFRRNSVMRPSLKERQIHENLLRLKNQDSNHFLFLLCSSKTTSNKSTHSMDHSFSCLNHRSFQRKHVNVINLGDTTHMEYKTLPSHTASHNQGVYSLVVKQQEEDFLDVNGQMEVRQIQSLNGALSRKLEEISMGVAESETVLSTLEEEVNQLRKQVRLKTLEEEQKLNPVPVASTSGSKKPSVDDILFMDISDGNTECNSHDSKPSLASDTTPIIQISKPKESSNLAPEGDNSSVENDSSVKDTFVKHPPPVKAEIKLTSPVSLHSRSNSEDKTSKQTSINSQPSAHVRSKSADVKDPKSKGTPQKLVDNDPFSFVSSVMQQSKQDVDKNVQSKDVIGDTEYDSDFLVIEMDETDKDSSKEKKLRNPVGSSENQQSSKMSTRSRNKHIQEGKSIVLSSDVDTDCDMKDNGKKMDIDNGESDKMFKSKNKTKLIGSKTCSQEVEAVQSEESSQDTYDMDVSSSPIY